MNSYQMAAVLNDWTAATPVGDHTVEDELDTAVTLTPPAGATQVLIQALTANIRYTIDGSTPTATAGFVLYVLADPLAIRLGAGGELQIIEESAGAVAQYQWLAG